MFIVTTNKRTMHIETMEIFGVGNLLKSLNYSKRMNFTIGMGDVIISITDFYFEKGILLIQYYIIRKASLFSWKPKTLYINNYLDECR